MHRKEHPRRTSGGKAYRADSEQRGLCGKVIFARIIGTNLDKASNPPLTNLASMTGTSQKHKLITYI